MLKNILKIVAIFVIGIVGGIFADQILWPYFIERPLFYKYRLEQAPTYVTEEKTFYIEENTALIDAIEKVKNLVVGIRSTTKAGKIIEGSGVIVTNDGLVLSIDSLVPQGVEANVFLIGKKLTPKVLQRKKGLVLLKVEESNLSPVAFEDFDKIKLGERVFLLGVILNKDQTKNMVNEGIIKTFDEKNIQTNISEKNIEGSPLFNIEGQLVGLNTLDKDGKVVAISIKTIREFLGF
jgi:S1-C subfamily serine protease